MPVGRPRLQLDAETIEALSQIGCTNEEIAVILRCSSDTLVRNYADALKEGRSELKYSLRKKQAELALGGNVTMLIWLGKQLLGQGERQLPPEGKPLEFGNIPTASDTRTTDKPN